MGRTYKGVTVTTPYMLIDATYVATQLETTFGTPDENKCNQLIAEVSDDIQTQTGEDFLDVTCYPDGVPPGIQGVACRAVIRGMLSDPSNLVSEQIGDVIETYGGLLDYPPGDQRKLDQYGGGQGSVTLETCFSDGYFYEDGYYGWNGLAGPECNV